MRKKEIMRSKELKNYAKNNKKNNQLKMNFLPFIWSRKKKNRRKNDKNNYAKNNEKSKHFLIKFMPFKLMRNNKNRRSKELKKTSRTIAALFAQSILLKARSMCLRHVNVLFMLHV